MVYFGSFFAKLGHFAGFFYKLFLGRNSEAVMGRGRGRGHNMINMKITELYALSQISLKLEFLRGFLYSILYSIILISPEGTAKLRWRGGGGGAGPGGKIIVFRLQRSSISIQRSSVGRSVAQKGIALLRREQRS